MDTRTSEVWVGTSSGVVEARTIRRKPEPDRWPLDQLQAVRGSPWDPSPGVDAKDMPTVVKAPVSDEVPPEDSEATEPGFEARRMRLSKADFEKHGLTEGCDGCRAIRERIPREITMRYAAAE